MVNKRPLVPAAALERDQYALERRTSLTPYWPVVSMRSSEKAMPG